MDGLFDSVHRDWHHKQQINRHRKYSMLQSQSLGVSMAFTTRSGGRSVGNYDGLNLATHVGDELKAVECNRRYLNNDLDVAATRYLNQTHSVEIATDDRIPDEADGLVTSAINDPAIVMTADCMPVMICAQDGSKVAAIHAGWKGLLNGVVEKAFDQFEIGSFYVIGPHISQSRFEVGSEVRELFLTRYPHSSAYFQTFGDKYLFHMAGLVDSWAVKYGFQRIAEFTGCTYCDERDFYSYRRQSNCGRQASLIWRQRNL